MIALRTSTCVIALNSMVAAVSMMARAADETLTLACQGTANMTGIGDTGPVSMGLVVDLRARTVAGFREQFTNYQMPLKITQVKEEVLVLGGQLDLPGRSIMDLSGFMDRMTGDMTVTATQRPPVVFTKTYSLKCTPAQRMF
jgi:hypothetical protein